MSFGLKDPAKEPLEGQTTYLASYRAPRTTRNFLQLSPLAVFAPKHPCSFFSTTATSLRHRRASSPCTSLVTPVRRGTSGQAHSRPSWTKKAYLSGGRKQRHCAVPWDSVGIGPPLELRPPSEETQRRHLWRIAQGVPQKGTTNICKQRVVGHYQPAKLPPIGRLQAKERFLTTKNVTFDATGEYLKDNIDEYPAASSECWGQFMAYKDDPMNRTKLREEYERP
ncbi:hypothetical protein C3747_130g85 [Trypanosoma cruzi]|uniref:Uncharacterized protein n=1 Tax=Trypanosoma cruzi TaxID=5693 RepID=A0A2V2WA90_TRYCR|nr:hypothetical protein C3747_130g85 [Trypanosoma cruzi]